MMNDDELRKIRDDIRRAWEAPIIQNPELLVPCLKLIAEIDRLRAEVQTLQLRPPMGCYTCEGHNDQLVDRIERMCEAVCAECAAKDAFVDAQKWPLPPREGETSYLTDDQVEELRASIARGQAARVEDK